MRIRKELVLDRDDGFLKVSSSGNDCWEIVEHYGGRDTGRMYFGESELLDIFGAIRVCADVCRLHPDLKNPVSMTCIAYIGRAFLEITAHAEAQCITVQRKSIEPGHDAFMGRYEDCGEYFTILVPETIPFIHRLWDFCGFASRAPILWRKDEAEALVRE